MADEKISERRKAKPEAPAPSGQTNQPAGAHRGARCPWWEIRRPPLVGPAMPEKTERPIKPGAICYPWYG